MGEKTLKEYLGKSTKDELVKKMKVEGLKYTGLDKTAIVGILDEYLQDENTIGNIWNGLSPFEREYLDEFLKYDESPEYEKMKSMYQKYGIKRSYSRKPWEEQSKMGLFFIGEFVPPQIKRALKKYLTPIIVKYDTLEQPPVEKNNRLNVIGDSFASDFCSVINLANSVKLASTKQKRLPTKSAAVKIDSVLFNKDFVFEEIGGINDIRGVESTNRIYGIYMLLEESGLLEADGNVINVTGKVGTFLSMRLEDKCKYLFKHYLKSRRIYELERIVESEYKTENKGNMTECRNVIMKHLKRCPVGMWVSVKQFIDYIKIADKKFLMDQVKYISHYSEKHRIYVEPWVDWEEVEGRFIEVVIQEYLSVLGIVDTVIYEAEGGSSDYDEMPFFRVEYFRITPLGAFVLGISKEYSSEEQVTESGFTVEDGFQIKVTDELSNQVHKLFFERFASKEEYPQYCIYKISFGAIVKALDKGITIESIIEYIRSHSFNGIPSELATVMLKWKKDSDKVVIKNITIVQTENRELLEELQKGLNIKKYIVNDLSGAFEINPDSASKVKREIEKNEYYCRLL